MILVCGMDLMILLVSKLKLSRPVVMDGPFPSCIQFHPLGHCIPIEPPQKPLRLSVGFWSSLKSSTYRLNVANNLQIKICNFNCFHGKTEPSRRLLQLDGKLPFGPSQRATIDDQYG